MNYGTHSESYPMLPYFTAAAAVGQTTQEIDLFLVRLDEAFAKFRSQAPKEILAQNAALIEQTEKEEKEETKE